MEYVTRELVRHGITDIVFAVGYKGTMVEEHFGDGAAFGFHAGYAYEETLLGTAGAIKNAGRFITEDRFYVLNADTWLWYCAGCLMFRGTAGQFWTVTDS